MINNELKREKGLLPLVHCRYPVYICCFFVYRDTTADHVRILHSRKFATKLFERI